jgi:hypothetical protein
MKNFTPEQLDEMHSLMSRLGSDELEQKLVNLEKAFKQWKKGSLKFTEIDHMILEYCHFRETRNHTDPVVTIADAIAENRLQRDMISDELFKKIEIVVRLMKN